MVSVFCPGIMIVKSLVYENHLLLDSPFAKQEGEQVTKQQTKKQEERKTKN